MMEINRISLLEVDSTNNYASNLMKSETLPHGSVITAQFQTHGRGQREHTWASEANKNLMASWVFHFSLFKVTRSFAYNQAIALALRESIAQFLNHEVYIKWPNDIVVQNKKLAGILIENMVQGDTIKSSICGIGVNVFQQSFEVQHASSMILQGAQLKDVDEVLYCLHQNLLKRIESVHSHPVLMDREYLQHLYQFGKNIDFYHNQRKMGGQIKGVDEWGRLLLETHDGKTHHFQAGEIQWIWA
jgi:BirA family biotin operon repressor/biotin-[acetyl-CoA-carboxylase] ligase